MDGEDRKKAALPSQSGKGEVEVADGSVDNEDTKKRGESGPEKPQDKSKPDDVNDDDDEDVQMDAKPRATTALAKTKVYKRGSKQRGAKKPKDMPKRPLSAYNVFFKDQRNRIVEESKQDGDSNTGFVSMVTTVAVRWKELRPEDKVPYQKQADEDMVRYRREMEEYELNLVKRHRVARENAATEARDGGAPKPTSEVMENPYAPTQPPAIALAASSAPQPAVHDTTLQNAHLGWRPQERGNMSVLGQLAASSNLQTLHSHVPSAQLNPYIQHSIQSGIGNDQFARAVAASRLSALLQGSQIPSNAQANLYSSAATGTSSDYASMAATIARSAAMQQPPTIALPQYGALSQIRQAWGVSPAPDQQMTLLQQMLALQAAEDSSSDDVQHDGFPGPPDNQNDQGGNGSGRC